MVRPAAPKLASLLGVVGGNTTDQREPADRSAEREHAADARAAGLWPN
jgi:hypothetical protein